jgi:hypothetical protein
MLKYLAVLIFLFISVKIFIWSTNIDQTLTSGELQGFKIGDTHEQVYKAILESAKTTKYDNRVVLYNAELKGSKNPLILHYDIMETSFSQFEDKSEWILFFDSGYFFDSLNLYFCEKKLCKVRRKRTLFEWSY